MWVSFQIFPQQTKSIDGYTRPLTSVYTRPLNSVRVVSVRRSTYLQHLVCRCIVFYRSLLSKNPQETQSLKSRRSSFPSLNEFATLSFASEFLGLFCMNPRKLTRNVDRRKDTLEFSRADFSTLQTKSIDGQKRPLGG